MNKHIEWNLYFTSVHTLLTCDLIIQARKEGEGLVWCEGEVQNKSQIRQPSSLHLLTLLDHPGQCHRFFLVLIKYNHKMLVVLAFIIIFHITSIALLFIATIDNAWWVGNDFHVDIWKICLNATKTTVCSEIGSDNTQFQAIQAIQATMILSTILCCIGLLSFGLQLFRLKQGERFVFTAIIQMLSCLCVMIAAAIYSSLHVKFHPTLTIQDGTFGYSFILAWIAFAFTLINSIMYLVLRKRK